VMLPLVILIFWMGIHPNTFLWQSEGHVTRGLALVQAPAPRPSVLDAEVKR
jgi:hypothetical protein